jgi:hypothetical protein
MECPKLVTLLSVPMFAVVLACQTGERGAEVGDAEDTAPAVVEQEAAGTDHPSDLNPVEAETMIDDVTIGHMTSGDNTIMPDRQGDDFSPGQPVFISVNVSDATAGSAMKVLYFGSADAKVAEKEVAINEGAEYVAVEADTTGWPKGDYRAEIWIGDEKVNTQRFNIVDAENASGAQ